MGCTCDEDGCDDTYWDWHVGREPTTYADYLLVEKVATALGLSMRQVVDDIEEAI
jgi:hypothetical protein